MPVYRRNPHSPVVEVLKPSRPVTDRARRYRANQEGALPAGARRCNYCASDRNVIVHHVHGDERKPATAWACRSCNARLAAWMKRAGLGRRTRQFNPAGKPITSYSRYHWAVGVARGYIAGNKDQAWADILATPKADRSRWTAESWESRRAMYGDQGGATGRPPDVPF